MAAKINFPFDTFDACLEAAEEYFLIDREECAKPHEVVFLFEEIKQHKRIFCGDFYITFEIINNRPFYTAVKA